MRWRVSVLMLCLAGLVGCCAPPPAAPPPEIQPDGRPAAYRALCVGLTAVEPQAYGGWAGDCPGCDIDSRWCYAFFMSNGVPAILLQNEAATIAGAKAALAELTAGVSADERLVLWVTWSGHGGQVRDDNGDEADGLDETLCAWDGQWRDDDVLLALKELLPPGALAVLITDTCHAEGNFRRLSRVIGLSAITPTVLRGIEPDFAVIQLAGCREAKYSYGSILGGTWTQTLRQNPQPTLRQWFDAAAARMPGRQTPVWVEFGPVTDADRWLPCAPNASGRPDPAVMRGGDRSAADRAAWGAGHGEAGLIRAVWQRGAGWKQEVSPMAVALLHRRAWQGMTWGLGTQALEFRPYGRLGAGVYGDAEYGLRPMLTLGLAAPGKVVFGAGVMAGTSGRLPWGCYAGLGLRL